MNEKDYVKDIKTFCWSLCFLLLILGIAPEAFAVGTVAGTEIKNIANATYQDTNGNSYTSQSNEVTTIVSRVVAVDVSPETAEKAGVADPNQPVSYGVTVTNTGNAADTFDLTTFNSHGWNITIVYDVNGDGIYDPAVDTQVVTNTGLLQPDQTYKVILLVEIPAGTPSETTSSTDLTATSRADTTVYDTGTYITDVLNAAITVNKRIVEPITEKKPGNIVTYAICGQNIGTATADDVVVTDYLDPATLVFQSGSVRMGPLGGTYDTAAPVTDPNVVYFNSTTHIFTYNWGPAPPCSVDPAKCSGCIYFQAAIMDGIPSGTNVSDMVNVSYLVGTKEYTLQSSPIVFQVISVPQIHVSPDQSSTRTPGDQVVYPIEICNTGNATDTIDITYTTDPVSTLTMAWIFWMDVNGDGLLDPTIDYQLTDTDHDGRIDTGPIPPSTYISAPPYCQQPVQILAVSTVPIGSTDGSINTIFVTGTSSIAPYPTSSVTLVTSVSTPYLSLYKEVKVEKDPNGIPYPPIPGKKLTYTITVTNTGSGLAKNVVISDPIPAYTTYQAGSIYTGPTVLLLVSRTDATDGDNGQYNFSGHEVIAGMGIGTGGVIPDLPQGGTYVLRFTVMID